MNLDEITKRYEIEKQEQIQVAQWLKQYGEPFYYRLNSLLRGIELNLPEIKSLKLNEKSQIVRDKNLETVFTCENNEIIQNNERVKIKKCIFTKIEIINTKFSNFG